METLLEVENSKLPKLGLLSQTVSQKPFKITKHTHLKVPLIKSTDFICWFFESFKVKEMEIRLKASLLTAEIHCRYSHIIRYTFRQEGDVLHNSFVYPYHILSRVPRQVHPRESKCLIPPHHAIQSFSIY